MNYLALGQRLALECGVSGTLTTMAGQVGSLGRLVNWVNSAWEDVQTAHDDWFWMRSSALLSGGASVAPAAGIANVSLGAAGMPTLTTLGKWLPDTFRNYATTVGKTGEIFMQEISYDAWRDGYMYGAQAGVKTRPIAIAIGPDKSLCFGPPSDGTYTMYGDYYQASTYMALDTDVPFGLPPFYHVIIVAKAMTMYGEYESAQEVLDRGTKWYNSLLARLELTNTPGVDFAGSL